MADEDDEAEGPAVPLGEGESVEGAPVARVASRLTWGIERSEIRRKEGDTSIRTPDGAQPLADVLDEIEIPYFERRQEFLDAVRDEIGVGPIPTAESEE